MCAFELRDALALKALACFKSCMTGFFFLPFSRIVQLLSSLVHSVFLYGAELWAPFASPANSQERCIKWLFGTPRFSLHRLFGWFPLDDLNDLALSRTLRIIFESLLGGFLNDVVCQFLSTYDEGGASKRLTWAGRFIFKVRKVWPSFSLKIHRQPHRVLIEGVPFDWKDLAPKEIASLFLNDCTNSAWGRRCTQIFSHPPSIEQQDYIFHAICRRFSDAGIGGPIFSVLPNFEHYKVSSVLKFLTGSGDFARTHAHFRIRREVVLPDNLKRACLHCATSHLDPFVALDSEWHFLFECRSTASARNVYRSRVNDDFSAHPIRWDCSIDSLVSHVALCAQFPDFFHLFAQCVATCFALRFKADRSLTKDKLRQFFAP